MAYVHDTELRTDEGTVMATFKSHWQAVAAMIRLSNPIFVSLGGDSKEALDIERNMKWEL